MADPYDDPIRVVFDIAISSLDFGSGFLDNAEVRALRTLAVQLGVDPDEATPFNWLPWNEDEHRSSREILEADQRTELERLKDRALDNDTQAREKLTQLAYNDFDIARWLLAHRLVNNKHNLWRDYIKANSGG